MKHVAFLLRGLSRVLVPWAAFSYIPFYAAEPRIIPGLQLELMPISVGAFTMGSPANEPGHRADEAPQTRVVISHPFWLGQTVVTQAQWRVIMGTDLVEQARRLLADDSLYFDHKETLRDYWHLKKDSDPSKMPLDVANDAPIYWVSWEEAVEFCHRLTERERAAGRLPPSYEYRLPTEAEWEYACRAGTTTATYAGDLAIKGKHNAPILDDIAWYGGNSNVGYTGNGFDLSTLPEKQYPGGTGAQRAVATKKPNAWGLYDMIGNVTEWCSDWYANKLPGGEVVDPRGPDSGALRVMRGACWINAARFCRAACRWSSPPGYRFHGTGFRIALSQVH
jgi:sulfatase modifying factor 1